MRDDPGPAVDIPTLLETATTDLLPALVARLLMDGGAAAATADAVARAVGLPSRFALARRFRRTGLITFADLRRWVAVDTWMREWEEHGTPLTQQALCQGADPARRYRTVKNLTGLSWSAVRDLGSPWFLAPGRDPGPSACFSGILGGSGYGVWRSGFGRLLRCGWHHRRSCGSSSGGSSHIATLGNGSSTTPKR